MKKKAIICDLDGTLAKLDGRSPYNASSALRDLLNEPIANILTVYEHQTLYDITLFLLTGRDEEYRPQTIEWLKKHDITHYKDLFMRPNHDRRPDMEYKKDVYQKYIEPEYELLFVLEDRDKVVRMWRKDLGLTCLQVEYGDF